MRSRALQYTLVLLLTGFIAVAVAVLATRSIWIDEAMFLRSVYAQGVLDFLHPLPYYDQASPFPASVVLKLISEIAGTNFILFRILIFAFIAICATPLMMKLKQVYGLNGLLLFLLVCAASVYNVLTYATEIKHYGFEVAGVFIFLYWFFIYLEDPEEAFALRKIWIPLLAIAMGFSTLLLVPAFFLFVLVDSVFQHENMQPGSLKSKPGRYAVGFGLMALETGILYMLMSYLTVFQMSYEEYSGAGYFYDVEKLRNSIEQALGHIFIPAIALSLISFFTKSQHILFRFSMFFILAFGIIVFLKFAGVYPVSSHRHVIWAVPIGMTFVVIFTWIMLSRKDMLGLFLVFLIFMFVLKDAADMRRGFNGDITNNNALYAALETLPASDVLVFNHARPSLEIYMMKNPALSKHRYFGLMADGDLSRKRESRNAAFAGGPLRSDEFTDWQFTQLPQTRLFYVLISHSSPIQEEPVRQHMILPLRGTLKKNDCVYESVFQETLTQILRVRCPHRGNGA
jgi:hypothetical protein